MDEAGRLDKVTVDRGWRFAWLDNDPYVFDERTGEVLRNLAENAGEGSEANAAEPDCNGVTVRLRLPGVRVSVRCAYQECADEIAAFCSASHVPEQASGPEVIVQADAEQDVISALRSQQIHGGHGNELE